MRSEHWLGEVMLADGSPASDNHQIGLRQSFARQLLQLRQAVRADCLPRDLRAGLFGHGGHTEGDTFGNCVWRQVRLSGRR